MNFKPRLKIPEKGNPYYNTKKNGGYSDAIKGEPCEDGLDVLRNCVGYEFGRFNEIAGAGKMIYLAPVNAELFIEYKDYRQPTPPVSQEPSLGACMVWQCGKTKDGKDGAGHVCSVEIINPDGSIITSESGYGSAKPFWTTRRVKGADGNWGMGKNYKFLGFIPNPAVVKEKEEARAMTAICSAVLRSGAGLKYRGVCGVKKNSTFQADGQYAIISKEKWLHGFCVVNNEHNIPIRYGGWIEEKYLR